MKIIEVDDVKAVFIDEDKEIDLKWIKDGLECDIYTNDTNIGEVGFKKILENIIHIKNY